MLRCLLPALGVVLAACGGDAWTPLAAEQLTAAQQAQVGRATAARDALFQELSQRLAQALAGGGPPAAIAVCKDAAPALAGSVSQRMSLRIGRTADRLRNPRNVPPDWAAAALAPKPPSPVYLGGPHGELGALLPIRLLPACTACHGRVDQLDPAVREQLQALYPDDRATGYADGDLRGWFWVEVPP